jgi:hypothetical protein
MKRSRFGLFMLVFASGLLAMIGCSKDDVLDELGVDEAVEAGLDSAIQDTVVPVVTFMGYAGDLLGARTFGAVCPDTSSWCSSGTAACAVGGDGISYDFTFSQCQAVTGDAPLLLNGNLHALPTATGADLTLSNLSINGSDPVSGTGTITSASCTYDIAMNAGDTGINGAYVQCDADNYPTGNTITISFDDFYVYVYLDGDNSADADAYQGKSQVADCSINLDSLTSACDVH